MDCARSKTWSLFAICFSLMLASQYGCAARRNSRELMPTPLAIKLGLPHPGSDLQENCSSYLSVKDAVPVFIVSGRNIEDPDRQPNPFGNERSRSPTLGVAYVRVDAGLKSEEFRDETTKVNRRKRSRVVFDRFDLSDAPIEINPWRVKDDTVRHSENPWVQAIQNQLARSTKRNVTIYVHGYNTEFIENTLLAGEVFHYMGRQGAMISFEWPSESRVLGYIQDKGNANYSTRHFRAMISNIAKECSVDSITIIAHSAGSPIVVNALREVRLLEFELSPEQLRQKYRIGRVVLAAPDMDMMAFLNSVHDRFSEMTAGVAIYASPKDRALGLSEKIYGSPRLGRAVGKLEGDEQELLLQVPNIELIDVSGVESSYRNPFGHSYFHRDPSVSSDLGLFILGHSPSERGLVKSREGQVFWQFPPDYQKRLEQKLFRNQSIETQSRVASFSQCCSRLTYSFNR